MELHQEYKNRCRALLKLGLAHEELNKYDNFKDLMTEDVFKIIMKDKQNRSQKRYRTKSKFKEIIQMYNNSDTCDRKALVFGTLTLNDYYLGLKENTYIRKIHKWLKQHFIMVILNKDFGEKKGREHYHFLGITTEELEQLFNENGKPKRSKKGYDIYELKKKDYELGFEPTICIIDFDKSDIDKSINYLLKLNNHSNKVFTKSRVRVIKGPMIKAFEKAHFK